MGPARRRLLGDHAAPSPRRVDHPGACRAAAAGSACRLQRLFGLQLEQLAVDGCITKAPCGAQVAGPSPVDRRKQGLKRSLVTDADCIPLDVVPAAANRRDDGLLAATLDTLHALTVVASCRSGRWRTWTPVTTSSPAARCWPSGAWPARSPLVASQRRFRPAAAGGGTDPRVGQPVRQAALVHRTLQSGGRALAGAGQRHHRVRPADPPRLGLLPLAGPPTASAVTTDCRRPL
jgi:hypothetical protein